MFTLPRFCRIFSLHDFASDELVSREAKAIEAITTRDEPMPPTRSREKVGSGFDVGVTEVAAVSRDRWLQVAMRIFRPDRPPRMAVRNDKPEVLSTRQLARHRMDSELHRVVAGETCIAPEGEGCRNSSHPSVEGQQGTRQYSSTPRRAADLGMGKQVSISE